MGFPLAPDAFPRVQLSPQDQVALEGVVDALVADTLRECNELRQLHDTMSQVSGASRATFTAQQQQERARDTHHHHHIDSLRWRLLKHRDNVRVYKERSNYLHARLERSLQQQLHQQAVEDLDAFESQQQQQSTLPMMMGVGCVQGTVDDVVYGLLSHTQAMAQIRASYVGDDIVDAQVLASLVRPSPSAPLRSLALKWCAKRHNGVCRSLVRYRDFVVVEATGVARDDPSVGYHVVHSVAVPGVRELHEMNVVRARISMCCLFRQQPESSTVELFMQGFLNPLGDVRLSAAMASAAEPVVAIWKTVRCAQMKKLAWEATRAAAQGTARVAARGTTTTTCEICWKGQRASLKKCQVCRKDVCSRCCVAKKLHFLSPTPAATVVRMTVLFCSGCVFVATHKSARELAVRESLALQDAYAVVVTAQTPGSTTPSSTRSRAFTSPASDRSCISSTASSYHASDVYHFPSTPSGRALLSSRGSRLARWFH